MVKINTLADLKQVKKAIETQARLEAERKAETAKQARQATADKDLFQQAAGKMQPLVQPAKAQLKSAKPLARPLQHQLDEQAALQETLSDEFDISTLLETDEHLSYRRPGIGPDVTRKLRRGDWAIQRQLDLHGLRTEDAREALGQFIREAHQQGIRCVRVVHGKGLGHRARRRCSRAGCRAGWRRRRKCWPSCRQGRPRGVRGRWWCCCNRSDERWSCVHHLIPHLGDTRNTPSNRQCSRHALSPQSYLPHIRHRVTAINIGRTSQRRHW